MSLTPTHFRRLFAEQRAPLYRLLFQLTRNESDAEDLLQETFLSVWRHRDQFEGRGSPEGYLRRTAFRLFLNHRRQRDRRSPVLPPPDVPDPHESAESTLAKQEATDFLVARISEAVETLPDGPREAFLLFRFEGMSCAQIAETTGAPLKTVETRLRRATQLLAEKLRRYRKHLPVS